MKSHEKVPLMTLVEIYKDVARMCCVEQDVRDLRKLADRFEHEGLAFISLALPRFGAGIESGLERGYLDAADFCGFSTKAGGIPRLFEVFTRLVFDVTGVLLDEPAPLAIFALRQLAYSFKKLKELCADDKINQAYIRFTEVEQELADFQICDTDWDDYVRLCSVLWNVSLPPLEVWDTVPMHGPGATADKRTGNSKYVIKRWHNRLEEYFPLLSFGYPNENVLDTKYWDQVKYVESSDEQPVKVIAVPKTAKTPRIIAIEPTCMQYAQQALSRTLVHELERGSLTKGHINFTDQSVNQRLAMAGSVTGKLATIDLSEASDRVLHCLVEPMFQSNPEFYQAIDACRSRNAKVNGQIIPLTKFASMGSALCFPIESMVFYTLCILGQLRDRKMPPTLDAIKRISRGTFVYGDDIVVPTRSTQAVFNTLQAFGCKVNTGKSFYRGLFRESCGCDAYAGTDVTPTYIRQYLPENRKNIPSLLSNVATVNQFYHAGMWGTAQYMRNHIERIFGKLPTIHGSTGGIGFESFLVQPSFNTREGEGAYASKCHHVNRWNERQQRYEIKALVAVGVKYTDEIDSYPALMKYFLSCRNTEIRRDFKRSSRRGAVTLKSQWIRPY